MTAELDDVTSLHVRTSDSAMDNCSILELDCDCLVVEFHLL